jgi:hypothetical protein
MFDVNFIDSGRYATEPSDPKHPNGKRVNVALVIQKSCARNLPYPAPRCGVYEVTCRKCGFKALVTVAGRADDPCMITLPCRVGGLDA